MNETIPNKLEAARLYEAGEFGNQLMQWPTWQAVLASDYRGLIATRYRVPGKNFVRYNIPFEEVPVQVAEFVRQGADPTQFYFNEMGPDGLAGCRCFQGEVMRTVEHFYLYYSTLNKPMRPALQEGGEHATGIKALCLLKHYLCASSFEDLQVIWDRWPDCVVEFTAYNQAVGRVLGRRTNFRRNTIFWEVRSY